MVLTSLRVVGSRDPPEPERRERSSEEKQGRSGRREEHGQLALLLLDADLRADLVVDAPQGVLVGGLEERAAGLLRDLGERLRVGRDADRPGAAEAVRAL